MTRAKVRIRCVWCGAIICRELQCVVIWYGVLQCVAVACCGLQWDVVCGMMIRARLGIKCVAVRCNDLQAVAVSYSVAGCCSELQWVTRGCSGLQWFYFMG